MDDLSEAGLDLERRELGKRLDKILISRGWNPKALRARQAHFTFSARRNAPDSFRVILDAVVPEAAAKDITATVARHGFTGVAQPARPANASDEPAATADATGGTGPAAAAIDSRGKAYT